MVEALPAFNISYDYFFAKCFLSTKHFIGSIAQFFEYQSINHYFILEILYIAKFW